MLRYRREKTASPLLVRFLRETEIDTWAHRAAFWTLAALDPGAFQDVALAMLKDPGPERRRALSQCSAFSYTKHTDGRLLRWCLGATQEPGDDSGPLLRALLAFGAPEGRARVEEIAASSTFPESTRIYARYLLEKGWQSRRIRVVCDVPDRVLPGATNVPVRVVIHYSGKPMTFTYSSPEEFLELFVLHGETCLVPRRRVRWYRPAPPVPSTVVNLVRGQGLQHELTLNLADYFELPVPEGDEPILLRCAAAIFIPGVSDRPAMGAESSFRIEKRRIRARRR